MTRSVLFSTMMLQMKQQMMLRMMLLRLRML